MQQAELTTEQRLKYLRERFDKTWDQLVDARKKYLEARTRKNYLESEVSKIESEIELIEQGQLCLGDVGA